MGSGHALNRDCEPGVAIANNCDDRDGRAAQPDEIVMAITRTDS